MAERPKAHDWKSCVPRKGTEGSNPSLCATSSPQGGLSSGSGENLTRLLYRLRLLFPKISGFALRFSGALFYFTQDEFRKKSDFSDFFAFTSVPPLPKNLGLCPAIFGSP